MGCISGPCDSRDGNAMKTAVHQAKVHKCRICSADYIKSRPLQRVCSTSCALELVKQTNAKREEKELQKNKRVAKKRGDLLKEAQAAFNGYIRARDHASPCISCQRMHQGQWHAGHYMSIGARPNLRFDERNVNKQCQPCNTHLHGNLINYRLGLIARLGQSAVTAIEHDHTPRHFSTDDIAHIKKHYGALARKIKKERENG